MDANALASLLVDQLGATFSKEQARKIYLRNIRFIPSQAVDDYTSIVLLEASEISKGLLGEKEFERICNRVSKRILYAAKVESQRFTELPDMAADIARPDTSIQIREIISILSLEEQTYLAMKMDGLTVREMAGSLGIPVSTAQSRWKNIADKIKAYLE